MSHIHKCLIFLLIVFVGSTKASAQFSTDIIFLKSGTEIVGVLDSIKRDTVFFRVGGRISVAYPMREVEKFSMQQQGQPKAPKKKKEGNPMPDSGFYFAIQNNLSIRGVTAQLSGAYRLNYIIQPMASVEMARYIAAGGSFLSVMAGLNGDFKKAKRSPFYSVQAGYGLNLTSQSQWDYGLIKNKKGGFKMEYGFGIRQSTKEDEFIWHYGLSISTQNAEYVYDKTVWNWMNNTRRIVEVTENITYLRFNLKLGVIL